MAGMDDAETVLVPGYRLDQYELLTPIASGGMASVWLARRRGKAGFEKLFAIKTIKTELTGDSRFQEMFLDEARIAAAIEHPNVSQILDLGEHENILYIVMEWVDGDSLAKLRRLAQKNGTPIPLGLSLRILADACAGLHAAHELCDRQGKRLNVVHRDVSPHNILVSSVGSVKIIDFGVAKALDRQAGETRTGVVKGKIRYMAPEQAQGRPLDRRADVWAIGVCMYEMVTGELPFEGESDVDILRRLMGDAPPPRPSGAVPRPVEDLLEKSLVRDPEARFPTAAAMQRAIKDAIDELGLPATNEDIAEFLHTHLLDLETKRREAVSKALTSAQNREGQPAPVVDDAAMAPTVLSQRHVEPRSSPEAETVAKAKTSHSTEAKPKRPKKRTRPAAPARGEDESKLTPAPAAVPDEKPAAPSRGLLWGVGVIAAAGAGYLVWSSGATQPVPEPPGSPAAATAPPAPPSVASAPVRPAAVTAKPAASEPAAATAAPAATPAASATEAPAAAASAAVPDAGRRRRSRKARPPAAEGTAAPAAEPEDDDTPYDDGGGM